MTPKRRDALLNELIAGADPALRDSTLAAALRGASRRRVVRRTRAFAGAAAMLALAVGLVWRTLPQEQVAVVDVIESGGDLVNVVSTESFTPEFSTTDTTAVELVETTGADQVTLLDDAALLREFEPVGGMLVRTGPDSQELVFAYAEPEETDEDNADTAAQSF